MILRCVDLEFTGEPTEEDPHAVVEVGYTDVNFDGTVAELGETWSAITNPGRPIPPSSRAVHHISDDEAMSGIYASTAFMRLMGRAGDVPAPDYFVAHNATAERDFFRGGAIPWICTFRAAVRLWPDEEAHKLQHLRYSLGLKLDQPRGLPAHRAGPDSYVGAALMAEILTTKLGEVDLATLVRWSKGAPLFQRLSFGKHKGKRFDEVPLDYLYWIIDKSDMGPDVKSNARHWIKKRA
ncbi:MAG: hypothetical protein O9972_09605 [Burkholderiales bacterium]|nr:hypothetical protein [Burkholderiales bacterium]